MSRQGPVHTGRDQSCSVKNFNNSFSFFLNNRGAGGFLGVSKLYSSAKNIENKRLSKVLAYVRSDHDGEALAAFHAARRIIKGSEYEKAPLPLQFEDTLQTRQNTTFDFADQIPFDQKKLHKLLADKSREVAGQTQIILDLNRQIETLEIALRNKSAESEGWRNRAWKYFWAPKNA